MICETYSFKDLADKAKETARDKFRYSFDYLHYDWWDDVYEDANQVAKILGLDIETTRATKTGKKVNTIGITFSGFCSQGDGASFEGSYRYNPEAAQQIAAYCPEDTELIRIASELTAMQTAQRLRSLEYFRATITQGGHYSHPWTMNFGIHDYGDDEIGTPDEDQFAQLMRDFADWIYKALENEYDHLMSDEVVDGYLEQEKFDESGAIV